MLIKISYDICVLRRYSKMPKERSRPSKSFAVDAGKWLSKESQRIKIPRVPDVKYTPRWALRRTKKSRSETTGSIMKFLQSRSGPEDTRIRQKKYSVADKENEASPVKQQEPKQCRDIQKVSTIGSQNTSYSSPPASSLIPYTPHSSLLQERSPALSCHSNTPQGTSFSSEPSYCGKTASLPSLTQAKPPLTCLEDSRLFDPGDFKPIASSTQIVTGDFMTVKGDSPPATFTQEKKWQSSSHPDYFASSSINTAQGCKQNSAQTACTGNFAHSKTLAEMDSGQISTQATESYPCSTGEQSLSEGMSEAALNYDLSVRFAQDSEGNKIFCRLSPTKPKS